MTVAVTRRELGAAELRREAGRCRDARAARRMLALALVLEGASRAEAARAAGMDRQTLRDWVHRYNEEGLPGLHDRRRPGPRPRLSPEQETELVRPVPNSHATSRHLGSGEGGDAGAHVELIAPVGVHVLPDQRRERVTVAGRQAVGPVRPRENLRSRRGSGWNRGAA